jgi:hypothetical protein
MIVRGTPAATDPLAVDRVARADSESDHRECLPAGRIALVRFALVEVEQPAEDERLSPRA